MFAQRMADASAPTFDEWYTNSFIEPLSTSETLGWKNISLYISRLEARRDDAIGPLSGNHFLNAVLEGTTQVHSTLKGVPYHEYKAPGSLDFHPAWHQSVGRWDTPVTVAFVQLSPEWVIQLAESAFRGDPLHVEIEPQFNIHDPLLYHLVRELCQELETPGALGAIFAESAAQMITLQMLRNYSNVTVVLRPVRARLSQRQQRVINEYIESNLDQKISLAELASLLFMSQSHFERLFRASLGCAPYHYVLDRKIERARRLLSQSDLPLHQVAERCGFAHQSHFTRHFSHQVGVSPARFRERLRDE